jgi:hypothetical protein
VVRARRALPEHPALFVDHKPRLLQVLHDPLGEHLAGTVRRVLLEEPSQQLPAARDREADRTGQLVAKGAVVYQGSSSG